MEAEDIIGDPRIPSEPTTMRVEPPAEEKVEVVEVDPTDALATQIVELRKNFRERIKPSRAPRVELVAAFHAANSGPKAPDEIAVVLEKAFQQTVRAGGRSLPLEPFTKLPEYDGGKFQEYLADLATDYDFQIRLERSTGGAFFIVWDVPPLAE